MTPFMKEPEDLARHLEAAFTDEGRARKAAEALRESGLDVSVTVDAPPDRERVAKAEMRDEVESMVVGPGNVGPFTKGMTKGLAWWVPLAGGIGIVVGLILGWLVSLLGVPLVFALLAGAAIGAFAGGTIGFVAGGATRPMELREGERMDVDRSVVIGVHSGHPEELRRAEQELKHLGALRTDLVGDVGPLGPSSEEKQRPVRGD
jgi:hypothetical protein